MVADRSGRKFYPWVVVGLAFFTVGVAFGARSSFALFLVAVIEEFHWSRRLTSGVLLLGAAVWSLMAPFIGMLMDRFGARIVIPFGSIIMAMGFVVSSMTQNVLHFYIGMGLLMSLGFGALPMSTHGIIISNWFVQRRGTAMGIVASGMAVGVLVVVPLSQYVISHWGWRYAFLVLAGILAGVVAPLNALFQRHHPEDVGLTADFGKSTPRKERRESLINAWTLRSSLKNYRFWVLAFGILTGATPLHMIIIHQVAAVVDAGFSKELAAYALGLMGFFTSPGMIILGTASDRIGREWAYTLGSVAMIFGITFILLANDPSKTWMLYGYTFFFALGFASRQSLYPTIAADIFHGSHFGAINGTLALFVAVGTGLGPWLGGYLFDLFGNYHRAFWTANLLAMVSIVLIWIAGPRQVRPIRRRLMNQKN